MPDEMEYARIDNDVTTSSKAAIVETVSEEIYSSVTGSNDDESDDELEIQPITQAKALKALNTIRCFFGHLEDSEEHFKTVSDPEKVEVKTSELKERQSYINEYFKH